MRKYRWSKCVSLGLILRLHGRRAAGDELSGIAPESCQTGKARAADEGGDYPEAKGQWRDATMLQKTGLSWFKTFTGTRTVTAPTKGHCPPWLNRPIMEAVPRDAQHCPPDVEEIAEAYCMETLDRPARLTFEEHYLACPRCASVVASTDEYVRSMRNALERLRSEKKTREGEVA
jgi:hypothetical protein